MHCERSDRIARQPRIRRQDGRLWFSRETERQVYFVLTLIMLIIGILYKTGVL